MQRLSDLRFLFVTGKGGVGKSTVAASIGRYLASRGKRVLVAWPHGSLGQDRLWGQSVPHEPVTVSENLSAVAIEPYDSMKEYAAAVVPSRRVTDAVFDSRLAQGFLRGLPGLAAWAILGKAWFYATGGGPEGPQPHAPPYDVVVFDAPATGHGTDILRVPRIILDLSPYGRFRRDAEGCLAMLQDPAQTSIVPVTLLEDLPVTETEELIEVVRSDLELPVGPIIANQRVVPLFDPGERQKLAAFEYGEAARTTERTVKLRPREAGAASPLAVRMQEERSDRGVVAAIRAAGRRAIREEQALQFLERLGQLGLPVLTLPELPARPRGLAALSPLERALAAEAQAGYRAASA